LHWIFDLLLIIFIFEMLQVKVAAFKFIISNYTYHLMKCNLDINSSI